MATLVLHCFPHYCFFTRELMFQDICVQKRVLCGTADTSASVYFRQLKALHALQNFSVCDSYDVWYGLKDLDGESRC